MEQPSLKFSDLPVEIQENILSQDPQVLQQSRILSKPIQAVTEHQYIKQICQSPVSFNEFIKYVQRVEDRVGYMMITRSDSFATALIDNTIQSWTRYVNNMYIFNAMDYSIRTSLGNYIKTGLQTFLERSRIHLNPKNTVYLDLFSQLNILKSRLSCHQLDPNYASNYVLKYLEQFYLKYNTNSIKDQIDLNMYLSLNASIMKIQTPTFSQKTITLSDLPSLMETNQKLYLQIINLV